ncbi:hypothetical protein [Actinoplanes sp. HUAS TT8]|uniref:hypothetical protein n=1 Tax=Actinoplanes sp. HUAS TT8 TaxID=3447453 RepID=UPI003F5280CD
MRAGRWVAAAALLVTVLTGCDAGDERARTTDDADTVAAAGQVPLRTLTVEQARGALLTAADLPTGWTVKPGTDSPKKDTTGQYAQCPAYDAVMPKVSQADTVDSDFTAPDGADLSEALLPMPEADAKDLCAEFSAAVTACKKLSDQTDDGVPFDMYFLALSFPQLADETFAFRATATVFGKTMNFDTTVVRRGGVLVVIVQQAGATIDTGLTEDVARRAVTKIDAALI